MDVPKVAIAVTSFKTHLYLTRSLERLFFLTEYPKFDVFIIDYGTRGINSVVRKLRTKYNKDIKLIKVDNDLGIAHRRNLAFKECNSSGAKYFVIMDDDIIVTDVEWLNKLVHLMERLPQDVVAAQPIILEESGKLVYAGGFLYPSGTVYGLKESEIPRGKTVWPTVCTGGSMFITRRSLVREFYKCRLKPYCDLFFIQSEDVDFAIKIYLRGYKAVCTNITRCLHARITSQKPLYRIYHAYKNRTLLVLLNFDLLHLLKYIAFRLLHDVTHAIAVYPVKVRRPTAEGVILLIKAYISILKRLKPILKYRYRIQMCWRRADNKYFKKILLRVPLPLPLRKESTTFLSNENKCLLYTSLEKKIV